VVQLGTPDAMRGRVSSVNMVFIGASNEVGQFESGITAEWFGTVPAVVLGGIGTLLVVLAWAWMFPALRQVDGCRGLVAAPAMPLPAAQTAGVDDRGDHQDQQVRPLQRPMRLFTIQAYTRVVSGRKKKPSSGISSRSLVGVLQVV
jgi:hypothetical protein